MTGFLGNFKDNNYYFGNFIYGPVTNFGKVLAALQPGGTSPNLIYNLQNGFDISERIWAGYAMNTISLGNLRLQAGVRVESTADSLRANNVVLDAVRGEVLSVENLRFPGVPAFEAHFDRAGVRPDRVLFVQ